MPELPEVETVRAGLAPAVTGSTVTSVDVPDARILRNRGACGEPSSFCAALHSRRIVAVVRRGKFLWFPLERSLDGADAVTGREPLRALVVHLGMSGQLLLSGLDQLPAPHPHDRVRLTLFGRDGVDRVVRFRDQRLFGLMRVDPMVVTPDCAPGGWSGAGSEDGGDREAGWRLMIPESVAHIARDPLDPTHDDEAFIRRARLRRTAVKRVLLDQRAISGIGNIYADEALWRARIHPEAAACTLSALRWRRLLAEIRATLRDAIRDEGTSFDSQYRRVNGESGRHSARLAVYGRAGLDCPRCGRTIVRVSFANRSSHLCPSCQRRRG